MENFFEYNNKKIHYTISGTGKPLVLLHGFTESLQIWNHFSEILSTQYNVICIDLPGHGLSDGVAEVHSMEIMADVVHKILSHHEIENYVVIGHSMGGYVAMALSVIDNLNIKGLGLFHSTALADTDEVKQNRLRVNEIILHNHAGFLLDFIPSLFAPGNQDKYNSEINELMTVARRMLPENLAASNMGMASRTEKIDLINNLEVPVMYIAGKKDTRIPFGKLIEQIAYPKECHVLLLHQTGHMGYIEESETTLLFIKNFANRCHR